MRYLSLYNAFERLPCGRKLRCYMKFYEAETIGVTEITDVGSTMIKPIQKDIGYLWSREHLIAV